jgi:hypothetical protein
MLQAGLSHKKLMYLGSIDDKVVQYQKIVDPERQLLHTLFFSVLLGDPLVLNDGYLLHTAWGRRQLTDSRSPVRQLNRAKHLVLVVRSKEPYSRWIGEQAERTESYRRLLGQFKPGELESLDAAWEECLLTSWPSLDMQATMLNLLETSEHEVLGRKISGKKLREHRSRFEARRAKNETVRSAWEGALLEVQTLVERERSLLMEFANEAYHASFACGFAGGNGGTEVGIAGYGSRRLHSLGAYRQEDGESLSSLLHSERFRKSRDSLQAVATVYVTKRESDLYKGSRLVEFLNGANEAKATYRASLEQLLRSKRPTNERLQALEHGLGVYGDAIRNCFGVRENPAVLRVIELMRTADEWMERNRGYLAVASKLVGMAAQKADEHIDEDYVDEGVELLREGPRVVTNIYSATRLGKLRPLSLLPRQRQRSAYELSLDPGFVRESTRGIPAFAT